jgi:hypothetical protein
MACRAMLVSRQCVLFGDVLARSGLLAHTVSTGEVGGETAELRRCHVTAARNRQLNRVQRRAACAAPPGINVARCVALVELAVCFVRERTPSRHR